MSPRPLCFGTFELDPETGELRRAGRKIPIQEKPLQLLLALLERPGEVMGREELRERLWPEESFLEFDDNLNTAVSKLRHALGDSAASPRFVETVPRRGYRFLADVEAPAAAAEHPAPPEVEAATPLRGRRLLVGTLGSFSLVVLLWLALELREASPPLELGFAAPLTTAVGLESRPAFSPDGTRIAFVSDQLGQMDVWVRQLASGPAVVLTQDHPGYDGNPVWSPSGEWIAFASDREGGGIFVMTALGGPPRRLVEIPFSPSVELVASIPTLAWSPDGETLAYAYGLKERSGLFLVSLAGGDPRPVPLPGELRDFAFIEPAFAPAGRRLFVVELAGSGATTSRILSVGLEDGSALPVTDGAHFDRQPVLLPNGRRLLFLSDRGGALDIWQLDLDRSGRPRGSPRALSTGIGIDSFAVDPRGDGLVYTRLEGRSSILRAPLGSVREGRLQEASTFFSESHLIEHFDIGTSTMVLDSTRSGEADIWALGLDGKGLRRISESGSRAWHPDVSSDDRVVVYHALRDGQRDLYLQALGGGPPRALAPSPAKDWLPELSPDGTVVAFESDRSGNPDIWVVSVNGGTPRPLTTHPGNDHNPIWTLAGDGVVFASSRSGADELWLVHLSDGEASQLSRGEWIDVIPFAWDPEGDALYAWGRRKGEPEARLWRVRSADGEAAPLSGGATGSGRYAPSLEVAGGSLYFLVWERVGDLWHVALATEE